MPEQSEGNNYTSKINVFPVLHTIFFLLAGQKVDLFARPHGVIKSTLWPASRKKYLIFSRTWISFWYFIWRIRMKQIKMQAYMLGEMTIRKNSIVERTIFSSSEPKNIVIRPMLMFVDMTIRYIYSEWFALARIQISEWIGIVLIGSEWIPIRYFRQGYCKKSDWKLQAGL